MVEETKKYTIQIVNENGRIVKSETIIETRNNKERTITLLPSEKKIIRKGSEPKQKDAINNALETRGLERMKDEEANLDEGGIGILTITKNN